MGFAVAVALAEGLLFGVAVDVERVAAGAGAAVALLIGVTAELLELILFSELLFAATAGVASTGGATAGLVVTAGAGAETASGGVTASVEGAGSGAVDTVG